MPNIFVDQFPDFVGHFALQDAGESLIDLLPMKRNGLGSRVQYRVDSKLVGRVSFGSAFSFLATHDMSPQLFSRSTLFADRPFPKTHGYGRGRHVHSGWVPEAKPKKDRVALHIAGCRKVDRFRKSTRMKKMLSDASGEQNTCSAYAVPIRISHLQCDQGRETMNFFSK